MGDLKSDYMKRNDNREVKDIFTHNGYKQLLKSPTRVTRMSATLVNVIPTNITLHYYQNYNVNEINKTLSLNKNLVNVYAATSPSAA